MGDRVMSGSAPPYRTVKAWVKALAYSPDDIVLGPHTTLDPEGYESLHALLDLADPLWRDVFAAGIAPEENRVVLPGEEGYEDAFDVCPEPTCPLYDKAVMADHRHLRQNAPSCEQSQA